MAPSPNGQQAAAFGLRAWKRVAERASRRRDGDVGAVDVASLGRRMGLSSGDLSSVLPDIGNFSSTNVGFL
jgi:hypothetical protein